MKHSDPIYVMVPPGKKYLDAPELILQRKTWSKAARRVCCERNGSPGPDIHKYNTWEGGGVGGRGSVQSLIKL